MGQGWPRWGGWVLAGVLLVLGGIAVERGVRGSSDFRGFYRIWKANLTAPMQPVRQHVPVEDDPDPYPPCSYVLFAPLGALPLWLAAGVWYVMNVVASWGAWRGAEALAGESFSRSRRGWLLVWSVLPFWVGNLISGQNGPLLMCLVVWGYVLAARKREGWGGVLVGVGTLIKAIPGLFLLPFALWGRWRIVAAYGVFVGLFVGVVCSAYLGPKANREFHERWSRMVVQGPEGRPANPLDPDSMHGSTRFNNQSVEGVCARLLMPVPLREGGTKYVNITTVEPGTWRIVTKGISLGVLLFTSGALFWRGWVRRNREAELEVLSLVVLTMLLISPIVWTHYYLWMFFPCAVLLRDWEKGRGFSRVVAGGLLVLWWVGELGSGSLWLRGVGLHLWLVMVFWGAFLWRAGFVMSAETNGSLDSTLVAASAR